MRSLSTLATLLLGLAVVFWAPAAKADCPHGTKENHPHCNSTASVASVPVVRDSLGKFIGIYGGFSSGVALIKGDPADSTYFDTHTFVASTFHHYGFRLNVGTTAAFSKNVFFAADGCMGMAFTDGGGNAGNQEDIFRAALSYDAFDDTTMWIPTEPAPPAFDTDTVWTIQDGVQIESVLVHPAGAIQAPGVCNSSISRSQDRMVEVEPILLGNFVPNFHATE